MNFCVFYFYFWFLFEHVHYVDLDMVCCSFFGFSDRKPHVMAETHEQKQKAPRRPSQDFSRLDDFLPLAVWKQLESAKNSRHRAEILSEFAYMQLGLRLPSEHTYGVMTAVVEGFSREVSQEDFHESLTTIKKVWASLKKRLDKRFGDDKSALLLELPGSVDELPEREKSLFTQTPPAQTHERVISSGAVQRLLNLGPLRNTHTAIKEKKKREEQMGHMAALRTLAYFLPQQYPSAEEPSMLRGLKIFSPGKTGQSGNRAALAASALSQGSSSLREALQDIPRSHKEPLRLQDGQSAAGLPQRMGGDTSTSSQAVVLCQPGQVKLPDTSQVEDRVLVTSSHGDEVDDSVKKQEEVARTALLANAEAFQLERGGSTRSKPLKRPASSGTAKVLPASTKLKGAKETKVQKRPAGAKPKPGVKKPAGHISSEDGQEYKNFTFNSPKWGNCKVEFYTQKSYIRCYDVGSGKYVMIIGSTAPSHHAICMQLVKHVKKGLDREALREVRETILKTLK